MVSARGVRKSGTDKAGAGYFSNMSNAEGSTKQQTARSQRTTQRDALTVKKQEKLKKVKKLKKLKKL